MERENLDALPAASQLQLRDWAEVGNRMGYFAKYCCEAAGHKLPAPKVATSQAATKRGRKRKTVAESEQEPIAESELAKETAPTAPPLKPVSGVPVPKGPTSRVAAMAAAAAAAAAEAVAQRAVSPAPSKRQRLLPPSPSSVPVRDAGYMEQAAARLPMPSPSPSPAHVMPPPLPSPSSSERLPPVRLSWKVDAMHRAVFDMHGRGAPIVRVTILPERAVELTTHLVADVARLVHMARPASEVVARAMHCFATISAWPLCPPPHHLQPKDAPNAAAAAASDDSSPDARLFQRAYYLEAFYNSIVNLYQQQHSAAAAAASSGHSLETKIALATLEQAYKEAHQGEQR